MNCKGGEGSSYDLVWYCSRICWGGPSRILKCFIFQSVLTVKFRSSKVVSKIAKNPTSSGKSFIDTNLIHNFYVNYIKLSSFTCFKRHPLIFRRSVMLIVHVCSLWYSHSVKVNYCFIVLGICYHFVKKENYVWLYSTVLDYQCVIE